MRFAFVTTEFPVTRPTGGGSGSYAGRMTRLLAEAGHEVDIFVPIGPEQAFLDSEMDWYGCRLHHVRAQRSLLRRAATRMLSLIGLGHLAKKRYWMSRAQIVSEAVEQVHAKAPFDVVHCTDSYGIGLGIALRPGRLKVVRCSAPMDLYMACDGLNDRQAQIHFALEAAGIQKADFAFAPCQLTARHYSRKLGRDVALVPTPIYLDVPAIGEPPQGTPPRYLLHFANDLMRRKGTDLVLAALPLALRQAPDLTVLCVGRIEEMERRRLLAQLDPAAANQVIFLSRQDRPALYGLIECAICTVLPSLIDNLPNTVLESLMLGVPVIGSQDSSIEELVEDGVTGVLVANGSAAELATAMIRAWTGNLKLRPGPIWANSARGRPFRPEMALVAYLEAIAGARDQPKGTMM